MIIMKRRLYGFLVLIVAVLSGCGATAPKEVNLYWPPPPEDPRIAYVASYRGDVDFKKKGFVDSFLGALFGEATMLDLRKPYGVSARGDNIYVSDTANGYVLVIHTREKKISYLGDRGSGKLVLPLGVAAAADGTVFVADAKLKKIYGYGKQGQLKVAIGKKDELKNPAGIAVNNALKRLYVVDSYGHTVHVYALDGAPLFRFGRRGFGEGEFNFPSNVAIDRRNNNVAVVDTQNFRVQVFDQDGKFLKTIGEQGDRPGTFSRPKGIGIDSEGNVYVVDAAFNNFQVYDQDGNLLIFIGGEGRDPGYFMLPAGMYVDENERIYVVDSFNFRVQVYQFLSEKWKQEHPEEYKKYQLKGPGGE